MATSGTATFNLDLNNLIEEAFERCGRELRTGYDFRTARRSLNLLSIEWANRGINLWTVEEGQIPLVTGQAVYALPVDTIDLLDHVIRQNNSTTNQIDINISRISESTYSTIPNKLTQGRPIQVWINRQSGNVNLTAATLAQTITATDTTIPVTGISQLPTSGFINLGGELIAYSNVNDGNLVNCARGQNGTAPGTHIVGANVSVAQLPCINIWPTPNAPGDQYTFVYWRLRRIQDAGVDGTVTEDIPFRFLPCMVAGLAYYLSMKLEGVQQDRIMMLKADYEQQWQLASDEDREKASVRFVPRQLFY